jgi:hypothetical protein
MKDKAEELREAIEHLINVKLHDALAHSNGLDRLIAHRCNGVTSPAIRQAEHELQKALQEIVPRPRQGPAGRYAPRTVAGAQEVRHENRTSRPAL